MSFIQNFFTSRDNKTDGNTYVGQEGRLWYNPDTNSIYVNTANIVGGTPVSLATGANIVANNLTVNTITSTSGNVSVTGNLVISGNISPAGNNKIGGIFPGPGVVISNQGELTIDTANLPLSFGNFTASNNILSIVNVDEDMILATEGNAEIQLIGNIGFYRDSIPPNPNDVFFSATNDGQVEIFAVTSDNLNGAVKITGNQEGITQTPVVAGVLLQLTGQPNIGARIYSDSSNARGLLVGRRFNGTDASPTPVLDNEEIYRIAATGYPGNAWPTTGSAQIRFIAEGDQSSTNQGGRIEFTTVPVGNTAVTTILTVNAANGANATKFTTSGTISAAGNITGGNVNTTNISLTGNVIGNVITGGVISATGNITGGNILTGGIISSTGNITGGNVIVEGVIRYDQAVNNATGNAFNKTGGTVTANGRTGQVTSNADLLAKGAAGTFTINNDYITSSKDVVIVNIASGASVNSYAVAVTAINSAGSCNVTVTNNGSGGLSEAIVFNFAVIKVS